MFISQAQIRDVYAATPAAAATLGRPNEVIYIESLNSHFVYSIDATASVDSKTVLTAAGTNGKWKLVGAPKNNFTATTDPTVSDDSTKNYDVGSMWVNTATHTTFICVAAATGTAVWNSSAVPAPVNISMIQVSTTATINDAGSSHYNFNETVYVHGSDLSLVLGGSGTGGKITGLKAGKTYRITAHLKGESPASGYGNFKLMNLTLNQQIGKGFQIVSNNSNTTPAELPSQTFLYTPVANCDVAIAYAGGTIGEITTQSTFTVEEIPTLTATNISLKNNLVGTAAPSTTDDASAGYEVGSTWVDVTNDKVYICVDSTNTSAIWHQIDSSTGAKNNYTATAAPTAAEDTSAGYSVGSIWADVTNDKAYICIDATNTAAIWHQIDIAAGVKNNYTATAAPTATDAASAGYAVGSFWVDVTSDKAYICLDATNTSAVWHQVDGGVLLKNNYTATAAPTATADTSAGYAVGSVWVDVTNDKSYICVDATATSAIWNQIDATVKFNMTATVAPTVTDGANNGYSVNSLWYDTTNKDLYICTSDSSTAAVWVLVSDDNKSNYAATVDPVVTDDGTKGYSVGSVWVNITLDKTFMCVDSSTGAAIWHQLDGTGVKNNYAGTAAPTASNDTTQGYTVGSIWVDASASNAYICISASTGAAVWHQLDTAVYHNVAATGAPNNTTDKAPTYQTGSLWYDTTNRDLYVATAVNATAASWFRISDDIKNNFIAAAAPATTDDSTKGYIIGSLWVNNVTRKSYICVNAATNAAVWHQIDVGGTSVQNNFTSTTDPVANNGTNNGYDVGSLWVNTTTDKSFICLDSTVGASIWKVITPEIKQTYGDLNAPTVNDDSSKGYATGSIWVSTPTKIAYICVDATIGAALWKQITPRVKNNLTATTPPTANDDISLDYAKGSLWLDMQTDQLYMATDTYSLGAAIWRNISANGRLSSSYSSLTVTGTTLPNTAITIPGANLGSTAFQFDTNSALTMLNGVELIKNTEYQYVSPSSLKILFTVYAGDVITVKSE